MKVLFDTSVLVAAIVEPHQRHARALPWLVDAKAGKFQPLVCSHSLAELYGVLTTLPLRPRIAPGTAWQLIHNNVETVSKLVPLSTADYQSTLKHAMELGLSGGKIYDALIARAAHKAGADRLLTFNQKDFRQVWPEGADRLVVP